MHLIKLYLTNVLQFTFWNVYTWASSPEGGFWSRFSHLFCIASTGNKAALTPNSRPQRRRSDFELWDKPCCHTLPDSFSPPHRYRESRRRICSVTHAYISALWVFALFTVLQFQWDFMPKSYTKYYIRVRRKFYKFVKACEEYLTTKHNCVILN